MKRLEGRVALVTGAASGIGRATAERLAREGAVAVITDVQDSLGEETAGAIRDGGGQAAFLHLDVTDETGWGTAVERVLADHGHLDILVNNAGLGDLAPIEETTLADWERTIGGRLPRERRRLVRHRPRAVRRRRLPRALSAGRATRSPAANTARPSGRASRPRRVHPAIKS